MMLKRNASDRRSLPYYREEKDLPNLGLVELIIILAIVFFIFGGRKVPQISRGFGLAIRNFKKGLHEPDAIDVTPKKEDPGEKPRP